MRTSTSCRIKAKELCWPCQLIESVKRITSLGASFQTNTFRSCPKKKSADGHAPSCCWQTHASDQGVGHVWIIPSLPCCLRLAVSLLQKMSIPETDEKPPPNTPLDRATSHKIPARACKSTCDSPTTLRSFEG